jgi:hypothetical protein
MKRVWDYGRETIYLLCFENKSLLKYLDFEDHVICNWIRSLKFAPSVHIEWVFKLL